MFVFLSKLLPPLLYPLGLVSLLILLALILWRRPKAQRVVLIIALICLWLSGNHWTAMSLARSLEWRYTTPDPIPQAEVVVVLGGGTEPADPPRPLAEVNGAGDRLIYAAWLYGQGSAEHILVSGGLLDWMQAGSTPAEDMAALLQVMGVPEEAIWLQSRSRNTYEDALYSAEILRQKGIGRALLVTSAWHMPRAVRLFQAQGLEVIPLPTDYNVTQSDWEQLWRPDPRAIFLDLLPSADAMALTARMLKEYLGLIVYELRGWT